MATANPKAAEKAVYIVISPLEHNLKAFAVGDEIELTEAQAAPLLPHTVKPQPGAPSAAANE
jgi:hypothetical protein